MNILHLRVSLAIVILHYRKVGLENDQGHFIIAYLRIQKISILQIVLPLQKVTETHFNLLMYNVPKWSETL